MTLKLKMMPVLVIALSLVVIEEVVMVWCVACGSVMGAVSCELPNTGDCQAGFWGAESRVAPGMGKDVGCGHQALGWDRGPTDF